MCRRCVWPSESPYQTYSLEASFNVRNYVFFAASDSKYPQLDTEGFKKTLLSLANLLSHVFRRKNVKLPRVLPCAMLTVLQSTLSGSRDAHIFPPPRYGKASVVLISLTGSDLSPGGCLLCSKRYFVEAPLGCFCAPYLGLFDYDLKVARRYVTQGRLGEALKVCSIYFTSKVKHLTLSFSQVLMQMDDIEGVISAWKKKAGSRRLLAPRKLK